VPFVVRRILAATNSQLERLIGDAAVLRQLQPEAFTDAVFGMSTVTDILRELEKPGRDPRPVFKTVSFREGVEKLEDLQPGMVLEGVVNVAAFPVPMRRELPRKELILLLFWRFPNARGAPNRHKFPVNSLLTGNSERETSSLLTLSSSEESCKPSVPQRRSL